jgi:hypothetical protein
VGKRSKTPDFAALHPGYKRCARRTYGRMPCAPTIFVIFAFFVVIILLFVLVAASPLYG